MNLPASFPSAPGRPSAARAARALLLALGVALASGVALAAWSTTAIDAPAPEPGLMLPSGPRLDRLLDGVQASPTQRAQVHQIVEAADKALQDERGAARADRAQLARLFAGQSVDAASVEALRRHIEQRHDLASRRATQALLDVSLVLSAPQRQAIAAQLAGTPDGGAGLRPPQAALAAF